MIKELNEIRMHFPQLKQSARENFIYLDNASTSLKPQAMIDALSGFYSQYVGNINRTFTLTGDLDDLYYNSIEILRKYFNIGTDYELIFTSGTTEAVNIAANCFAADMLEEGACIYTSVYEHHSNYLPWKIICENKGSWLRQAEYDAEKGFVIEQQSLEACKFAALAHASNVTGTLFEVDSAIKQFRSANIPVLIDAAQSAPHSKLDIDKLNADFVVFSAHKMLGPFGIGALIVKKIHLEKMKPWKYGGGMVKNVSINKWHKGAMKFEAGTQNPAAVAAWAKAVEFIQDIGIEQIQKHTKYLLDKLYKGLRENSKIKIFSEANIDKNIGIVSFDYKGVHPHDVGEWLNYNNIMVRVGHHCAQPLLSRLNVKSLIRASVYLYNSEEEIQRFIQAISSIEDC